MKTVNHGIIGAIVLLMSGFTSQAITNTAIAVSGTNIVLSWPCYGYESYLVQNRQTLDPSDSWSELTNSYPANSTNRTTFTVYGAILPPGGNGNGGSNGNNIGGSPPGPDLANSSLTAGSTGPMVVPTDGSGVAVPLLLYPPGFNLSGFTIFDPVTGESVSGSGYATSSQPLIPQSPDNPQPMDGTNDPPVPATGFFRVFHIPNWLADFSGYTFDGPTFIPVDYSAPDAPLDSVDNTTVLINGQPTDYAVFTSDVYGGVTNWGVGIYFDRFPNGTNTIQLLTTVRQSDTLNDQTPYMVFSNAPQTITIGNTFIYTNWADLILSNTYTFNAQSSVTNVNWEIDIYDVYDNFVNYQTGYSSDGNISWPWDLTDYNGNSRANGDADPFFFSYLTVTTSSGGTAAPNGSFGGWMPPLASKFPSAGAWFFAYFDKFYDDGTSNYSGADSSYLPALQNMEGGPYLNQIAFWDYPIKFGATYSQADRDASWQSLGSNYLQRWNIRNFYYFGHGAPDSIGGDVNTLDSSNNITGAKNLPGSKAYLTSKWVHDNVTFNSLWGPIPFRFVFLDGCDTAKGGWPQAWGVPKQAEPLSYYQSTNNTAGRRPSAFVGWDVEIGGNKGWGTIDKFWQFRTSWMAQWSVEFATETLKNAFDDAFNFSNWVDQNHYNHMKIFGYQDMKFLDYDHAGDWPQQ
jgi:hypothetical protein